jgi:hypothetical protein
MVGGGVLIADGAPLELRLSPTGGLPSRPMPQIRKTRALFFTRGREQDRRQCNCSALGSAIVGTASRD